MVDVKYWPQNSNNLSTSDLRKNDLKQNQNMNEVHICWEMIYNSINLLLLAVTFTDFMIAVKIFGFECAVNDMNILSWCLLLPFQVWLLLLQSSFSSPQLCSTTPCCLFLSNTHFSPTANSPLILTSDSLLTHMICMPCTETQKQTKLNRDRWDQKLLLV